MVSGGMQIQTRLGRKRKLKQEDSFNLVEEGSRHNEIRGEKDLNQMDQSVQSIDRISQLPEHVIHHIFAQLRNVDDAVRTSVLSKRWRALWYSYAVLVFDERKFIAGIRHGNSYNKKKRFKDYVSNSLQTRIEENPDIQKLVLHMTSFNLKAAPQVAHWLSIASGMCIKELDLHFGIKNSRRYSLPETFFLSKTLTGIRLSGCKLDACDNIMLPYLRRLCLQKIDLAEHNVQNFISGCRSIEDLRFIECAGLKNLQVSNLLRLNRVDVHHCKQLNTVDLSAPNLDTFWYRGKKSTSCKVNLEGCKSLRRLSLDHPQVTREFCKNEISKFPLLENLDLSLPDKMKYVTISNPQLRRIVLKGSNKDAKLSLESRDQDIVHGDRFWFLARAFIRKFDSKGFKLVLQSSKNIAIHEDLTNISLPPLPDLSIKIFKSPSARLEDIVYGSLRTHPVLVTIISPRGSDFLKLVYTMIRFRGEDPICCSYSTPSNKCWRHFLKDVKIKNLNGEEFEVGDDKCAPHSSTWCNWCKSLYASRSCQMINLRLFWSFRLQHVETAETLQNL
nr:putative FBD-associated F-box protein At5g22720 isoform X1 [Arachis hypogaea]